MWNSLESKSLVALVVSDGKHKEEHLFLSSHLQWQHPQMVENTNTIIVTLTIYVFNSFQMQELKKLFEKYVQFLH